MTSVRQTGLVRKYLEFIRFSHTVFALPFALLACVWALVVPASEIQAVTPQQVSLRLIGVVLCMVCARSAAMAFNRLVDAEFDRANPRTANRHLPAGTLTRFQAWSFFVAMSLLFVACCSLFLPNWLPLAGALPVLAWICGYSLAKRFTSLVHVWLGIALALSPVCAWIAMRGEQVWAMPADVWPAVGLGLAIAAWVAGFDIIYACQDADFDKRMGLRSVPARWGIRGALRWAAGLHGGMLVILALLPSLFPQLSLGWLYATAWCLVAVLVVRQHWILRPTSGQAIELGRVNEAFFQINAVISFSLSAIAALDACLR
jgi:4-hydroxybenzoate polyprenyltransferase